jgi:hypothetical protein
LDFLKNHLQNIATIAAVLTKTIKHVDDGGNPDSLATVVSRGNAARERIAAVTGVRRNVQLLWKSQRELDSFRAHACLLREVAQATLATKALGQTARTEALALISAVEPRMKRYYAHLYDDVFKVDLVTSGHAANPNVKDEINVYFRAGDERVPVTPFSNAGRLRALMLCFIFAMLDESKGSLGLSKSD